MHAELPSVDRSLVVNCPIDQVTDFPVVTTAGVDVMAISNDIGAFRCMDICVPCRCMLLLCYYNAT